MSSPNSNSQILSLGDTGARASQESRTTTVKKRLHLFLFLHLAASICQSFCPSVYLYLCLSVSLFSPDTIYLSLWWLVTVPKRNRLCLPCTCKAGTHTRQCRSDRRKGHPKRLMKASERASTANHSTLRSILIRQSRWTTAARRLPISDLW